MRAYRPLTAALFAAVAMSSQLRAQERDPASIVGAAQHAVERDNAPALRARWASRLRRDANDRAAAFAIATLARMTYDSTAERLYDGLVATPARDDFTPWAHLGRGQVYYRLNRRRDSREEFERAVAAARAAADTTAEASALIELSFARGNAYGVPAALATLDSAALLLAPGENELWANLLWHRSIALNTRGDTAARSVALQAIARARRSGSVDMEGAAERALAQAYDVAGEHDSAFVAFHRAESLFRRAHDRNGAALVMMIRANLLRSESRLGEARQLLDSALVEARAANNQAVIGAASTTLGALALHVGDLTGARRHLEAAYAHFAANGDSANLILVAHQMANTAFAASDYDEALRLATADTAYSARIGDHEEYIVALQLISAVHEARGDYAAARGALRRGAAVARAAGQDGWVNGLARDEARPWLREGNGAQAERLLTRYLAGSDTTDHLEYYEARILLAEAYVQQGRLARALRELTEADAIFDAWRATLADREMRVLAFQTSTTSRGDQRRGVARILSALALGGYPAEAFAHAERRRARELAAHLQRAAAVRTGADTVARRSTATALASPVATDIAARVAELLGDSTALLEFVAGRDDAPTTLFVVHGMRGRPAVIAYRLPSAESFAPAIARLTSALEGGGDAPLIARELGTSLLGSAIASLGPGVKRLVIVPDGIFHRVPFDALRLADDRYVVERYAVGRSPSAGVLLALARRRSFHDSKDTRLLAMGDPAFGRSSAPAVAMAAAELRSAFDTTGGLAPLPASGREAKLVARYAPNALVYLGRDATVAALKRAPLDSFRVLHFATHALVDDRSLDRTALALAPDGDESGFLTPADLAALPLDADLVVLSACRTAGGVLVDGEGVQGLTAPLLEAGARSVIATSWRIGDRGAVPFVGAVYDALASGLPVADALRAAKLDAIRRGAPPSEWAAFQATGDPLVTVPLRAPPRRRATWWLLPFAMLATLFAAWVLWRRQRTARRRRAAERSSPPSDARAVTDH